MTPMFVGLHFGLLVKGYTCHQWLHSLTYTGCSAVVMTGHINYSPRSLKCIHFFPTPAVQVKSWSGCEKDPSKQLQNIRIGGILDLPLMHSTLSPNSHFWDFSVWLHCRVGLEGERDPGRGGLGRVNDTTRFSGLSPVFSPTRDNLMGS